eukprot:555703-Amphidinium_carterae.1
METVVLEKTLIKLGSLLAIGFGEAGANIVSHNMSGADLSWNNVSCWHLALDAQDLVQLPRFAVGWG